jgi:hypothetical protein
VNESDDQIPPSRMALREALQLSEEILKNIELSDLHLANVALKTSRLARLVNDFAGQKIMQYEASGYPSEPDGVVPDVFELACLAGRKILEKDEKSGETKTYIYVISIEALEQEVKSLDAAIAAARDPDVSVSSANPSQTVFNPSGNFTERNSLRTSARLAQERLSSRRSYIYSYVLRRHHELRFSGIADDIFSRIRERVDSAIGARIPLSAQKLSAVYVNLQSENPENWANAVHSCRRILQDLADALYPARADVIKDIGGKPKPIKLGSDNYINRLIAYLEEKSSSERFRELTGSNLAYVGDRLDSIFQATQKGSHANVSRQEADRYVVYTYLIVGDILSL